MAKKPMLVGGKSAQRDAETEVKGSSVSADFNGRVNDTFG